MKKRWMLLLTLVLAACRLVDSAVQVGDPQTAPARAAATQAALPICPEDVSDPEVSQAGAMLPTHRGDLTALNDIPFYNIALTLEDGLEQYSARINLHYTNRETVALDQLYFRLLPNAGKSYGNGALDVTRVSVDGQAAQTELSEQGSVLRVALAQPLQPGSETLLRFDVTGRIPQDFGGGDQGGYGIFNHAQGVLVLTAWYPMLAVYDEQGWNLDPISSIGDSVYADAAYFSVRLEAPSDLVVAATGVETGREQGSLITTHCLVSGPVREFLVAAGAGYEIVAQDVAGTQVNAFYLPGHAAGGQAALEIGARSVELYNEKFGVYPYSELDILEAPLQYALGVEFPGAVLIASSLYDQPQSDNFIVATAHEVAHQWWYNLVGNDVFGEPWLDEGLASFSSALYYEDRFGEKAYAGMADYWQSRYDLLVKNGEDDLVTRPLDYFEKLGNPRVYSGLAYSKAALFYVKLRREMGDERFFAAMQQYYLDHRYGIATTDQLLAEFQAKAGANMDAFFQSWLYSEGTGEGSP